MVSATRVPNNQATFLRPMDSTEYLAPWIDRSPPSPLLQLRLRSDRRAAKARQPGRSLLRGVRRCHRHALRVIALARYHELPGDAGSFVGERHRREFGDLRDSSARSQGEGRPRPSFACWITAVAPATSTLRNISSPARVILPSRSLPAVE